MHTILPRPSEPSSPLPDSIEQPEPISSELFEVLPRPFLSPTGLVLPEILTYEQWDAIGDALAERQQKLEHGALHQALAVGAWYEAGEARFGEMAAQAKAIGEDTGLKPGTVCQYASLYRRFGNAFQDLRGLTIKHLQAVRSIEDQSESVAMLLEAQEEGLDAPELRERVRQKHPAEPREKAESVEAQCLRELLEVIDEHGCPTWLHPVYSSVRKRLDT